ncbi:hypothetical protein KUW18_03630, partial [Halomonas sp. DP5Y7-2]|uniref:hypothetical protein n=1 Tax=Halomonas sp. DP5Y7-2 TaxID=2859076 RepID=UPI001C999567
GTVESSYWGTGLDSAYSLGATVQHQDEMASIGSAGSADTTRVYDQAYWSAMGGGAEVDTTDVDIVLTLSGGGVAAKAAASGIRRLLQSRVSGAAGVSLRQTVDDLLSQGSRLPSTGGKSIQFQKNGGYDRANADFDSLGLSNVREISMPSGGSGRVGTLSDGRKVVVRSRSSERIPGHFSQPTLEIQNLDRTRIKIRY